MEFPVREVQRSPNQEICHLRQKQAQLVGLKVKMGSAMTGHLLCIYSIPITATTRKNYLSDYGWYCLLKKKKKCNYFQSAAIINLKALLQFFSLLFITTFILSNSGILFGFCLDTNKKLPHCVDFLCCMSVSLDVFCRWLSLFPFFFTEKPSLRHYTSSLFPLQQALPDERRPWVNCLHITHNLLLYCFS